MLERFRIWISGGGRAIIDSAVTVETSVTAHGDQTKVKIDQLLPEPGRGEEWRFRVTTRSMLLPDAHFDRAVRARVNAAAQERGRRIYAIDRESQEVVAVLSYHVDETKDRPLLVTALGTRTDRAGTAELFRLSTATVWLLKQYAHAIAAKTARGAFVDMDASTKPDVLRVLADLGFRNAPRVPGFVPSGKHLRQDPVSRR